MEHFTDKVLGRKYNLTEELVSLETLCCCEVNGTSVQKMLSYYFLDWPLRNNYIAFNTFFQCTGLKQIVSKALSRQEVTPEEFIYYCEYVLNVLAYRDIFSLPQSKGIFDNIINVLKQLNYTVHEAEGVYHILGKDTLVSEAASIVQDNYHLDECIYSFNYRELKGDLHRKADILCRLYKYIESISSDARQYGYTSLFDDIKNLSNKLDVRHAPSAKQEAVIGDMPADEYEEWLDELFRLSLSLIVLVDYTKKKKDINELKAKLG